MNRQKTCRENVSGMGVAARRVKIPSAGLPAPSAPPGEPLMPRKYRELIQQHLGKLLDKLFADFTGVHFHIAWMPAPPRKWDAKTLPTGCSVCCRLAGARTLPWAGCLTCGPKHLAAALKAERGHRFTCPLGLSNYWFPVQLRGEMLGIAYLQALDRPAIRLPARKRAAFGARPLRNCRAAARHRLGRAGAKVLSRLEFARASRFLQLIIRHVQTASLSDLRKADLTSAGRVVLVLEKEQARLHETLKRHIPVLPLAPRRSGPESHPEQIVHRLLERIELDYRKPITLQQYARELGMNAAYLSALFSRAVGVSFKAHLIDLRMAKAKELLGDPTTNVSAVAGAVGYASENRFRLAFKKATGLPPKLWRETMQPNPPPTAPPSS